MAIFKKYGPVSEKELDLFLSFPRPKQITTLKQIHGPGIYWGWIDWPRPEIKRMLLQLDKPTAREPKNRERCPGKSEGGAYFGGSLQYL